MTKYAKWVGGGLGWAFAGPVGGIVGWVVGALVDYGSGKPVEGEANENEDKDLGQYRFAGSMLVLVAAVMKADGRTLKSELDHVKRFLLENFGEENTKSYLIALRDLLNTEYSLHDAADEIKRYLSHPARLQLLHFLYGLANADNEFHRNEYELLEQIARLLGINSSDNSSIRAMFGNRVIDWYAVLEVHESASDDEVKKAFRRMSVKYHPDKVHSLGEEAVKGAEEKFRQLNEAYENIKKQRGMV